MATVLNKIGFDSAFATIEAGNVNRVDPWDFTADDGNKILGDAGDNWAEYEKWFLGLETTAEEKTKERFKYPFGKDGTVYRSGLVAIRVRSSQQGEADIFEAAGELIELIDGETETEETGAALIADAERRRDAAKHF